MGKELNLISKGGSKILAIVFGVSVATSQFYFFDSGMPQPSHYLMLLFVCLCIISTKNFTIQVDPLLLMVSWFLLVNLFFSISLQDMSFLLSNLQIVFGYLTYLSCRNFFLIIKDERYIFYTYFVSLLTLSTIAFFSFGRFYYDVRYMAFFNDPNQMAFWVLCITSAMMLSRPFFIRKKVFFTYSVVILSTTTVILTQSRSGLLGLSIIFVGVLLESINISRRNIIKKILLILILPSIIVLLLSSIDVVINRFIADELYEELYVRGYFRLIENYEYLILGSGQGLHSRFGSVHEIHSTWAGVLFYYGVLGAYFFLRFLYKKTRHLSISEKCFIMSPLVYGISTYGLRTPVFWILLATIAGLESFRTARVVKVGKLSSLVPKSGAHK